MGDFLDTGDFGVVNHTILGDKIKAKNMRKFSNTEKINLSGHHTTQIYR
jgi:hypothetical protein